MCLTPMGLPYNYPWATPRWWEVKDLRSEDGEDDKRGNV